LKFQAYNFPFLGAEPEKLKKYCPLVKGFVNEKHELTRILAVEVALLVVDSAVTKDIARYV